MNEAFDAATSFAASFAEADLARAAKDPNHTERTERWLQQQGLSREAADQLRPLPSIAAPASKRQQVVSENDGDEVRAGLTAFCMPKADPPTCSYSCRVSTALGPPLLHPSLPTCSYRPSLPFRPSRLSSMILRPPVLPFRLPRDSSRRRLTPAPCPSPSHTSARHSSLSRRRPRPGSQAAATMTKTVRPRRSRRPSGLRRRACSSVEGRWRLTSWRGRGRSRVR